MHTHSILCVAILISGSFLGCSDSDADVIPTGQFDDGGYEIFGPPVNGVQPSLGLIYAHKGIAAADYNASYEIWAVDNAYCSSDKLDKDKNPCKYQALTFKYVGEKNFIQWTKDVNAKKYDSPRYYRATYRARSTAQGLGGCGTSACTFEAKTDWSTRVSMFPANKILNKSGSPLPTVVVQQASSTDVTTTETWYMKAFFNSSLGDTGFEFSNASETAGSMPAVDCAACTAAIQVDVKYKPCTAQPIDISDQGCVEKNQ